MKTSRHIIRALVDLVYLVALLNMVTLVDLLAMVYLVSLVALVALVALVYLVYLVALVDLVDLVSLVALVALVAMVYMVALLDMLALVHHITDVNILLCVRKSCPICTKKNTRDNFILFYCFSELPENSTYVMKFLGEVLQLYFIELSDEGVNCLGNNNKGLCCSGCQKSIKSSAVESFRQILKKRAYLFRCNIEV